MLTRCSGADKRYDGELLEPWPALRKKRQK